MENKRLVSLDAFRGFTIAAMILVNFPGNWDYVFAPFRHSEWWGITFTDIIAPFFLFTVGVSIALAYTKRLEAGVKPREMYKKLFIRSLKIFAVGMFLNLLGIIDNFRLGRITVDRHIAPYCNSFSCLRCVVFEYRLAGSGRYRGGGAGALLACNDAYSHSGVRQSHA